MIHLMASIGSFMTRFGNTLLEGVKSLIPWREGGTWSLSKG